MVLRSTISAVVLWGVLSTAALGVSIPLDLQWTQQFGTSGSDKLASISADGLGNVYAAGSTSAGLGGTHFGNWDGYLAKYDSAGTQVWAKQLGTSSADDAYAVAADGLGSVYVAGWTEGVLDGVNAGSYDGFLSKYDDAGNLLWSKQSGSSSRESYSSLAIDALGNVFVSGATRGSWYDTNQGNWDVVLTMYDTSGNQQWSTQIGTSDLDSDGGLAVDGLGNVYWTGSVGDNLVMPVSGNYDWFLCKYDTSGNQVWARQYNALERAYDVVYDGNDSLYVTGDDGNGYYIGKYDTSGNQQWLKSLSFFPATSELDIDAQGNIVVTGSTSSVVAGTGNAGEYDAFVLRFNPDGTQIGANQLGSAGFDFSLAMSTDALGNIWIGGYTDGAIEGANAGDLDSFLTRFVPFDVADTNLDGDVDTADLTKMFQHFTGDIGLAGGKQPMHGDTDLDGDVDTADLTRGFQHFTGSQAGLSSLPTPEPSSFVLLAMGAFGLLAAARRSRRPRG